MSSSKCYQTGQSISRKIDAEKQRAVDLLAESEGHGKEFVRLRDASAKQQLCDDDLEAMGWAKTQSVKKRKQSARIMDKVIPKLSAKLAEFNTQLLPGCGDDRSVSVK